MTRSPGTIQDVVRSPGTIWDLERSSPPEPNYSIPRPFGAEQAPKI